jgi:UDP-N-acetylmuramate--alanine ligase
VGSDPLLDGIAGRERTLRFDADRPGPELSLRSPGTHNLLNARGALAALALAGLELDRAAVALARFPGILRRQERKGTRDGIEIFDDYAHHPTEVTATLAALRELGPRRLVAVFQPHLYSRTKALAARFGAALADADAIGVLDVYAARERPEGELAGVSGLDIARAAAEYAGGRPVWWLRDAETARRLLEERLRAGDLLVTIGAGDIHELASQLVDERMPAGSSASRPEAAGAGEGRG